MKLLFDRRYPVTSLLLLVTTAVFLSMFIRFGGDYQTGAAIYYSGGIIGEVVKVDPSQLWRIVTATFVHIGLGTFCAQYDHPLLLRTFGRRSLWIEGFLALYLLSGMMGNVFVAIFTPDVIAAGASTALFGLFGTIGALRFIVQSPYIRHLSQSYTSLIVVNLIFSFMPGNQYGGAHRWLSSWGHVGLCLPVRGEARFMNRTYQMSAALSYLLLLLYFLGKILNLF